MLYEMDICSIRHDIRWCDLVPTGTTWYWYDLVPRYNVVWVCLGMMWYWCDLVQCVIAVLVWLGTMWYLWYWCDLVLGTMWYWWYLCDLVQCVVLVILVRGYSSIRVSHAGRRSACWVRSDETDWKTQLPPHMGQLLSYFTLTFLTKVILQVSARSTIKPLWCFSHQSTFHPNIFWPTQELCVWGFEQAGISSGRPTGPLRNPALFSN